MGADGQLDKLVSFADEVGLFYEDLGLPRAWGRVLGWLLVCEPALQSAEELAVVLHASRGSISMATRSLIRMGCVERQAVRGDRRAYYRIQPGTWVILFEHQLQSATKLSQLANHGLELLNGEPPARRDRMRELQDFIGYYERECRALIAEWHRDRAQER
jgi:DNA-binding transcriptional regulator GbsR (MarR family)